MDRTSPSSPAPHPAPRPPRRPPGWVPPGPPGGHGPYTLGPDEDLGYLLGDWRILQRKDGHRWSLDDLLTAWLARRVAAPDARRLLDLGTGIGSVAAMLAWCFPEAEVTGVEAQELSIGLARRTAVVNQVEGRMHYLHADLRTVFKPSAPLLPEHAWDLVTGTPPYFTDPAQTRSSAVQKGPCRFEERGGIGDYLAAMQRAVRPGGRAVVCHASRQRDRVLDAVQHHGFTVDVAVQAIPKVGREPLVDVLALSRGAPAGSLAPPGLVRGASAGSLAPPTFESLVVRDAADQWTPEMLSVRLSMGMPPRPT
jgi:tRNA1(Val) A37 N6-methylase TrmN6